MDKEKEEGVGGSGGGGGHSPRNAPGILRVDTSRSRIVVQVSVWRLIYFINSIQ
jgi:hypothetical protein